MKGADSLLDLFLKMSFTVESVLVSFFWVGGLLRRYRVICSALAGAELFGF